MVLTNLGIAVAGKTKSGMQHQRKLKDWNCTKRRKSKISKSVEMWFNAVGSTTSHEGAVITSFHSWYGKAAWPFWTYSLTGRQPYSFPLFPFPFLYASCLAKFILNSLPSFRGRKYSKAIPACLAYKFTDPTSIFHQMILLTLAQTAAILKIQA